LGNVCTTAQKYIGANVRFSKEKHNEGNVKEFCIILLSNGGCAVA